MHTPLSMYINTYGTEKQGLSNCDLLEIVNDNFCLRYPDVLNELQIKKPIFAKTCLLGHFLKEGPEFTWETPKLLIPK